MSACPNGSEQRNRAPLLGLVDVLAVVPSLGDQRVQDQGGFREGQGVDLLELAEVEDRGCLLVTRGRGLRARGSGVVDPLWLGSLAVLHGGFGGKLLDVWLNWKLVSDRARLTSIVYGARRYARGVVSEKDVFDCLLCRGCENEKEDGWLSEVKGKDGLEGVLGSWCTYPSLMSGALSVPAGVPVDGVAWRSQSQPARPSYQPPRKGDHNQRSLRPSRGLVCVIEPLAITTRLGMYLYKPVFPAHG